MILEEVLGENFVHQVVGAVLVHLEFFEDDPSLANNLAGIEGRIQYHVAENIDGYGQMFIQDFNVEADRLLAGKGVHVAANGVDLAGDILGACGAWFP